MTTATEYFANVSGISSDIDDIKGVSSDLGMALDGAKTLLEWPGKIEAQLRRGEALDIPDPIVFPLSFLPTIGPAIKTLDNFAETAVDEIKRQADIMEALDDSWKVPRTLVSAAKGVNSTVGATLSALKVEHGFREDEAQLLVDSLGNQNIYEMSELSIRLEDYNTMAQTWFGAKAAINKPLDDAMAALGVINTTLGNLLSTITPIEGIMDSVFSVFDPVADAIQDIEDALCVVFEVTPEIVVPDIVVTPAIWVPPVIVWGVVITEGYWIPAVIIPGYTIPAVTVDICGILQTLNNQVQIVQDFVINTLNSLLASLGFDMLAAINDIIDTLLSPLQPVFDAIAALQAAAQTIIDDLSNALNSIELAFDSVLIEIDKVVKYSSLFNNTIEGDKAGPTNDILIGTAEEDAIFGLAGNDTINGGDWADFLFGGDDDDNIFGGEGDDEAFGGNGNDSISGDNGNDLVDGGDGKDTLMGQAGRDILIGGAGTDIVMGGGGNDDIHFLEGSEIDVVVGFADDRDELYLDSNLTGRANTGQDVVDKYAVTVKNFTILNFGTDKVVFVGVRDADSLADDIILI